MKFQAGWLFLVLLASGCSGNMVANVPPKEAPPTAVGEWPVWRGPHGNGISTETQWKAEWPDGGPPKLWTANVGTGFSSFSVAAGRLFTMGYRDGNDVVYCLDALTGKEHWKYSYPCQLVANLHEGGPASTPTIDESRVYTLSREGHLFCFDVEKGEVLWAAELQKVVDIEMPDWGFSSSPLVHGNMLLLEAGYALAIDKRTGKLIWKSEKYRPGYGTPVVFELAGEELVATLNNDCLQVVRAKDGSLVDSHPWESSFATVATTPIIAGNTIYISSGYNQGCALLELAGGELRQVYKNKKMNNHMNNCVLWQGHLYGFDGNSHAPRTVTLTCMEYNTGAVKWEERGLGCGSLMMAGDKLIVLGDQGDLVIAAASPEGFKPISRASVITGKCWTVPVLAGGVIYCRTAAGDLVALDVRT